MPDHAAEGFGPASRERHGDWMRLQTLVLLRWAAIAGQIGAIVVARSVYGIRIDLGACLLAIGAAVVANLVSTFIYPGNKRLSQSEATLMLLFDIAQLGLLLALTGGINNPFSLLILAPATIGASALQTRATVVLATATIAVVTLIAWFNLPLYAADGSRISQPALLEFGQWLAIVIGMVFFGIYARRVAMEIHSMGDALLATQMALAREQKLTDLGGVVAAAAHELGTPLATIKMVSAELIDELEDRPELREDAELIRSQADRCRDILRGMGRAGKSDLHLLSAPLAAVVKEAAEPHAARGKALHFTIGTGEDDDRQPAVLRLPEVIHGMRNLIQNAVDFARANVWVDIEWSPSRILLRIADDGPGYPPALIGRIGDPFMRRRPAEDDRRDRPDYEGMGLGLFIAKTLLERTGAGLSFANGADPFLSAEERPARCGAIIEVVWPRDRLEADPTAALGENPSITA